MPSTPQSDRPVFRHFLRGLSADTPGLKMFWRRVQKADLSICLCKGQDCVEITTEDECIEKLAPYRIAFTELEKFWKSAIESSRQSSWHLATFNLAPAGETKGEPNYIEVHRRGSVHF